MLDVKKLLTKILTCDLVIESGVSNGWYCRKWSSGRFECWQRYYPGSTTFSTASSIYYHDFAGVAFPITFTSTPSCLMTNATTGLWVGNYYNATSSNTGTIRVYSTTSASKDVIISIYATGYWK